MPVKYTREGLAACSHSIAEVGRRLGISPVGGNQTHIGRRIAELGIDTSHFTAAHRWRATGGLRRGSLLVSPSAAHLKTPWGEAMRAR
ncbi:hypothetical protein ACFW1M_04645 [Streptomyces inhibens]|uniref:hypothetical protein n=1 Tax=Streptomyces inhibens TaxID=2293571 RepID=UPI00368ABED0